MPLRPPIRRALARALTRGVVAPHWDSILGGCALVLTGAFLASAAAFDRAAGPVGVALAIAGVWQLERGIRQGLQARAGTSATP